MGKESDCGYSSSSTKSRDTLSSSLIEPTATTLIETSPTKLTPKPSQNKSSKEERTLKCKSNDSFRSIYVKNGHHEAAKLAKTTPNRDSETTSGSQLSHALANEFLDDDLSRALVGDSDEFIDLDDDEDTGPHKDAKPAVSLVCSTKSIGVPPPQIVVILLLIISINHCGLHHPVLIYISSRFVYL